MYNARQHIEQFHLIFLDQLGRKIDKRFYVLKGGCNLRFYFKSFRYSEDIDFDTQIISSATLRKNVTNILESPSLKNILRTREITIVNISTPKQTETTQRWKVTLEISGVSLHAHTKIEFSRRGKQEGILFEAVDSIITQEYHLPPVFLSHYNRASAIFQKISALVGRNVTQARDIFDLYLLAGNNSIVELKKTLSIAEQHLLKKQIPTAIENINQVSYADFQSQVVTYLSPDYQKTYSSEEVFCQMIKSIKQMISGDSYAAK